MVFFLRKSRAITLVEMCDKMMCNNPNVDRVNMNAYLKFCENLFSMY